MIQIEIVTIGNEVLVGDVLDTNTNWISKRITGMGGLVKRVVLVRDNLNAISKEIQSAIEQKIDLIITIGGMGPTVDDMTLEAVAQATNRSLELNVKAISFVKKRYEYFASQGYVDSSEITLARKKMGILPRDATPVENPVGAAPAVILKVQNSTIICLPGVPTELKKIFEEPLQPILKTIFGNSVFIERVVIVNCNDESILAPIVKKIFEKNQDKIYIKSRPKNFGSDVKLRVIFSGIGNCQEELENNLNTTLQEFEEELMLAGISIDSTSN
ncbi:competence/damage-inducible protein A [Scytonema hofmannii FACHB-248]|uniref:Competence/damage-inducible protein A n=1 Tax=Scytonema hofmannii FACHB-248 TaxID=1842502 RepID=A0ABR8GW43_9CYAN|nr:MULTISPECIES: molybdopterin-binding protein [Nostocales]MBD2607608.1 competence/damage-inducible protein A [Scytonema hofmannii FACHB-248]